MSRTYALSRLLEHGAMTSAELIAATGWPWNSVRSALENLMQTGRVEAIHIGRHRNVYRLA